MARATTDQQIMAYARLAVRDEYAYPTHGRGRRYDRQGAINDVLMHFDDLTNSDEDYDRIEACVRDAELMEYPDEDL